MQSVSKLLVLLSLLIVAGCRGEPAPLSDLNARWFDFTDRDNETLLAGASKQKLLGLKAVKLDLGGNASLKNSDLADLRGWENLVQLELYVTNLTDDAMESVATLPNLEVLDVSQTKVGDRGLESIGKIKTLKRLELAGTQVTDQGLKHLTDLPLYRIDLSNTVVTDDGMAVIAKIKGLERLHIRNTQVTGAGLAHISKLTHLRELGIYEIAEVTDAGLKHLQRLTSLNALFLGEGKYSTEGLAELQAALPKCDIAANN